ncbi:cytochrome P450 71A8-like [Cornus florida]|uniref:cytochrome P450 71A8-like n=1 Tax=Cornus florida TaxID=4283 RepID=UPI0028974A70|nr:cytochrome P450 71A8-like [Cornus florida]
MAPYGEFWRQMKSIFVLQLLSNQRVQSFHIVREEETALQMKKIEESASSSSALNLSEIFTLLTNDMVCRAAVWRKYSGEESGKKFMLLLKNFVGLLGSIDVGDFIPWLTWINHVTGFYAKLDRVANEIDEFLEQVVEERTNALKRKSDGDERVEDEGREDFLDILLRIHTDNTAVDRDCIKALILDTFSAGTDNTATVLEWAMTELLRHPIVMNKVQYEVGEILKGKPQITADDLEEMNYLKAVIKETVRLHPPIPLIVREASEDVRVMGYDIEARTMVMINAWAIGKDPVSWVEPEEFQPERFMNSSIDFRGHDFELTPFGAGRRGCPGTSFAMVTNEFVLANLMHKFNWALPDGAKREHLDMTECPGVTIRRRIPLLAVATPCHC